MAFSLKQLKTDSEDRGTMVIVHGAPGTGKTTLAAEIAKKKNGMFIQGEDGLSKLGYDGIARTGIVNTWEELQEVMEALVLDDHDFDFVAIDTIDSFMQPLQDFVVNKYYGGDVNKANAYKAMYTEMYLEANKLINAINLILAKGVDVMCIVHSIVTDYRGPDSEAFKRFDLNLPGGDKKSLSVLFTSAADSVLFSHRDMFVSKGKATGSNLVLETQWNPSWEAKSRGVEETKIPNSADAVLKYIFN